LPQSSPSGHPEKHTVIPQKGDEKLLLETVVMERGGSWGCSPWAASPVGGERGSPLIASSKCKKYGKLNDFYRAKNDS